MDDQQKRSIANAVKMQLHNSSQNRKIKEYKDSLKDKDNLSELEQSFLNTKSGYIVIQKISNNPGFINEGEKIVGYTENFGEGIALFIEDYSRWFHTSVITKINEDTFETLNSTYSYKFNENDRNSK